MYLQEQLRSEHTRRHVGATRLVKKSLRVYRSGDYLLKQVALHTAALGKSLSLRQNFVYTKKSLKNNISKLKLYISSRSNKFDIVSRSHNIHMYKKLMVDMRNESHPISFLDPQVMTRSISYQLRSGNTKPTTTMKRTKRAHDFFTFKFP